MGKFHIYYETSEEYENKGNMPPPHNKAMRHNTKPDNSKELQSLDSNQDGASCAPTQHMVSVDTVQGNKNFRMII